MAQDAPQDSAGPSSPPPPLPEGWLAQWEGVSRKWYFVQRTTGKSQWEIPTEPVCLTPSTTPGSIGAGPTQAPGMTSSPIPSPGMMNYGASRGIFSHSTEKAGLSGLLGSHGSSGLSQLADRMLNKISKEFMPGKTGASPYQQFPPGHPNHPGSQMPYGSTGVPPQYQPAANPYGYASTGYLGNYSGDVPQYRPQGQVFSPGALHQAHGVPNAAVIPPGYAQQHSPNQQAMPHQFSPVSPDSQSWQGHQSFSPGYPPAYQAPGPMTVPPVAQPQWQMGPQPTIPLSTKPTMNHSQQHDLNNSVTNHDQSQFHNASIPHHEQVFTQPTQPTSNPYSQGHLIYEAPGDTQPMGGPQGISGSAQSIPQQVASMYHQNHQHQSPGPQNNSYFTPTSGTGPGSPAVASNFGNNSSTTSVGGGIPNINPHQGNLSHHPSLTSLSSHHTLTGQPMSNNAFIAELPDSQVGMSQPTVGVHNPPTSQSSGPTNIPQKTQQPPSATVTELPGSEPIRHTPTDAQFVSGPYTSPPAGANQYPPQNR